MNVFLSPQSVMVTKLVIITSSLGIIISESSSVNAMRLPRNSSRANANAASVITISISVVVTTVKSSVFMKYRASGTAVNASA